MVFAVIIFVFYARNIKIRVSIRVNVSNKLTDSKQNKYYLVLDVFESKYISHLFV